MRIAHPMELTVAADALRATASALFGMPGGLFRAEGETFVASLSVEDDADVPGATTLLSPGTTHEALVQVGPDRPDKAIRRLCVKIPAAYGRGRDQDFLLASSGDGVPMHHAVLPADPVAGLYSSLWLYLAGFTPILFGAYASTTGRDLRFGVGDVLSFAISPPVGQFRRIAALTLTDTHDGPVRFSGSNSGGNIRPLPPVNFY
jgi:hypothetical protein